MWPGRRLGAGADGLDGALRLQRLGVAVMQPFDTPEHRLDARLAQDNPDAAHSRYNSLVRRLVSFERALACAR